MSVPGVTTHLFVFVAGKYQKVTAEPSSCSTERKTVQTAKQSRLVN